MFFGIALGILIVGVLMLIVGLIFRWASTDALKQPPVYDGIGGKDTDNLMTGCVGGLLGVFCLYGGSALAVIGLVLAVIAKW